MSNRKKLNQASRLAVDDLCEAAQSWGWQQDQGNNRTAVLNSEKWFNEAKAAMEKRLRYLETQLKKHRRLAFMLGNYSE